MSLDVLFIASSFVGAHALWVNPNPRIGLPSLVNRRTVLAIPVLAPALLQVSPAHAGFLPVYGTHEFAFLDDRCRSDTVDIRNAGSAGFGSAQQLLYPDYMAGTWSVAATFRGARFPKGDAYVPTYLKRGSARSESEEVGKTVTYEQRFVPPPRNLGGAKFPGAVIMDRPFSTPAMLNAYAGFERVRGVEYDADKSPTELLLRYPTVGPDMRPLPDQRTQVYINNRDWAVAAAPSGDRAHVSSECFRAVTLGPRSAAVSDSETLMSLQQVAPGTLAGQQRVANYLVPNPNSREGVLYMDVGPSAVAVFDWDVTWTLAC